MSVRRVCPREFGVEDKPDEPGCIICLHDEHGLPVTSCCGKEVHEECLLKWLKVAGKKSCPHCRLNMETVRKKVEQGFDSWTFDL